MGNMKVFVLMAGMTALFVMVGGALGGTGGMMIAFVLAAGMNLFAWFNSDKAALRAFGARIVSQQDAPQLHEIVDRLRQRAGLPMPRVAVAPQPQPNAFATGRNPENAVVCVTDGLLKMLDREEVEGVLAHELAHIKNRDMLLQTFSATLAGAVGMMSRIGAYGGAMGSDGRSRVNPLALILAPIAAMLIQFAISRSREFKADAVGAEITGRPLDLAEALEDRCRRETGADGAPADDGAAGAGGSAAGCRRRYRQDVLDAPAGAGAHCPLRQMASGSAAGA